MINAPVNMPTADQALARLQAGNARYVSARMSYPNQTAAHRIKLLRGHHPFAIILGCADSRIPPEIIFDQGLGDIFVIRVAGNIIDHIVLGSIEYAAAVLHTPLLMVLGHSKCGAVAATASGAKLPGHLPHIAVAIQPAVDTAKQMPGNLVDNAIRENAKLVTRQLSASTPILAPLVTAGKLKVVAAHYDIATGQVEVLPANPAQSGRI
jgi:carbonic anhydrase